MARKKPEEIAALPTHQRVRVNKQETYTELRPVEAIEEIEGEEEQWIDPFSGFSDIVTDTQAATINIWSLPNYETDGRTSPNGTERVYCGSVPYRDGDDTLLSQIAQRVPQGGTVSLELKVGGAFKSSGLLKIAKPQGTAAAVHPLGPSLVINQPAAQHVPVQVQSATEIVRDQFSMMREMVSVMKELTPAPPVVNVGESQQSHAQIDERPLQDRILEAVALKALENKDTPIDRVLEALGGGSRKESGWMDTFAPVLVELAKGLIPTIGMMGQQYMRMMMTNQPGANGQPVPVQIVPETNTGDTAAPVALPMDPAEKAWRRTVQRMLEDCLGHCEMIQALSAVGTPRPGDGMSTIATSESIADLVERFEGNEQVVGTVKMLLESEPAQVIEMCSLLQTNERDQVIVLGMKEVSAALEWLKAVQEETKRILSEGGGQENE